MAFLAIYKLGFDFKKNLDVVIDKTTQKKGSLFYEKKKFFFHFFDLALI